MIRTIVAFEDERSLEKIAALLEKGGIPVRHRCRTGREIARAAKSMGGGVVVCGYKLPDATVDQLEHELTDFATFLVVAKPTQLAMCENENLFRLPSPVSSGELIGSVQMLIQMDQQRSRVTVPQRSEEEQELVTRAKQLLMSHNNMTEKQAHQFMQKKSMATASKMTEVAKMIIAVFN